MPKLEKILVATDFSAPSEAALTSACELARAVGATVDLLHVWEVPGFLPPDVMVASAGADSTTLVSMVKEKSELALAERVSAARDAGLPVGLGRCEAGEPAATAASVALTEGYDLLVVGTHGRRGLSHLLLGSVAERIVRLSQVPVLVARVGKG